MLVGLCAMIIATPQTPKSTMSCLLAVGLTNNRQFVHICRIISALSSHNLLIDRICVASHEFPGVRWRNFRLARALFALVEYCLNTNMGPTGEWGAFARGRSVQKGGHMRPRLQVCLAMSPHVLDAISSSTQTYYHSLVIQSQSVGAVFSELCFCKQRVCVFPRSEKQFYIKPNALKRPKPEARSDPTKTPQTIAHGPLRCQFSTRHKSLLPPQGHCDARL